MKQQFLFILCAMVFTNLKAQDTDLDKFYFSTQEIAFPKQVLPETKRTYKFTGTNDDDLNFNENNAIVLNGFKKDDSGVVQVYATYKGGLQWVEQQTRPRVDAGQKTWYSIAVAVICDGRIRLDCKEIDFKGYIQEQFRKSYATTEFATEKEASAEFNRLRIDWFKDAKDNFQKFVVRQTNYRANVAFGYPANNLKVKLWLLSSKEHPEYANFQQQYSLIKNVFTEVKYDGIPKDILTKLAPAITYFEALPKQYAEDNKKHKKMRYAAYTTLMKIYFHIEDLAKAETYANLVISNDYDDKDGKKMLEAIQERKALWQTNKVSSSHFITGGETGANIYSTE